jgi:hypothetical protein
MKIVVFDLDETLGYFTQFGILWDCINKSLKNINLPLLKEDDFNNILDLYPECLRPHIIQILSFLKNKRLSRCCSKMMIYTNNSGPKEWAEYIVNYFEKKINSKLFDQIVAAFKINGKRIEVCRSSKHKNHRDFIRCTKIPENAEICYLDDTYYPGMANKHVFYINIKPYFHDLEFDLMIERLMNSNFKNKIVDKKGFVNDLIKNISLYKYAVVEKNKREHEVDTIVSKKVFTHLEEFFNKSNKNTTRRLKIHLRNKTSKNR